MLEAMLSTHAGDGRHPIPPTDPRWRPATRDTRWELILAAASPPGELAVADASDGGLVPSSASSASSASFDDPIAQLEAMEAKERAEAASHDDGTDEDPEKGSSTP